MAYNVSISFGFRLFFDYMQTAILRAMTTRYFVNVSVPNIVRYYCTSIYPNAAMFFG